MNYRKKTCAQLTAQATRNAPALSHVSCFALPVTSHAPLSIVISLSLPFSSYSPPLLKPNPNTMAEIPLAGLLDIRLPPSSFPKLTPPSLRRSFSLYRFSTASASTSTSSRATSSLELAASKGSYSTRYFDPVPSV